ncbi:putative toxin-antitoxin system toxin component, PIN family [Immundisolibacter cernigliae]|uniref:Putative toxin-antitoxin system toxin component, PIN family n=1 Tax=Immundisolibacter cernigliae TaxID=1810504 RepID=A0A1B1YRQ5_9GAMM|nr:putative toxin-antitoxin system toxin component, PIN family [Immundisolibacter cernigliae]ANX03474.1 putative toxin-antitoxin system toxin component, PIN family [Immundisolibacter cernigliae]
MKARTRVVVDTNVLLSRLLVPSSVPAQAVRRTVDQGQILASEATLEELADVLSRPKFDRYLTVSERQQFLRLFMRIAQWVPILHPVQACRDPRDDKFLALAVNGEAGVIITADQDLLVLDPFRDVRILEPAAYLAQTG